MSEVHRIAKQLQRTCQGRAFHGPALEEVLADVTAKTASAKPPGGVHTIWEIVLHVTFWQEEVHRWLQGRCRRPAEGEDWPAVGATTDAAWSDALRAMRSANESLRDEVMLLEESRLEEPIFPTMSKVYVSLHGIIQHNIYHAGQIAVLKKIVARR